MRGSIVKRGQTWTYVVDVGSDEHGKRQQRWKGGFRTRRHAESALTAAIHNLETGGDPFPPTLTFRTYSERWLEHQRGRLRPHPWIRYGQVMRDHVLPVIGNLTLERIRPAHVQQVLDAVAAKGLAPRSVIETRAILSSAMRQALDWDWSAPTRSRRFGLLAPNASPSPSR